MKQPRHLLVEAIAARTLKESDTHKLAHEIAAYLLVEDRVDELDSIMRDVIEYRAEHGYVEATAVTTHALTTDVKRDIMAVMEQEYPAAKSIIISERLDGDVVGGVRVDLPHEQLDLTLRSKLARFRRLTMAGKE
jgi:F0F1-type ATP synthase delta subunit